MVPLRASHFREDLKNANIGAGDHAYFINLDQRLDASQFDEIVVLACSQDGQGSELQFAVAPDSTADNPKRAAQAPDALLWRLLERTLKYSLTYAEASELLAPVGYPVDFINDDIVAEYASRLQAGPEEMRERIGRDKCPIPHPGNREGYAEGNHLDYWLSGYADHRMVQGIAAEYGVKGGRYFDFGGSTGRVFRNFALQTDAWDVWSCDFKISSVEFNLKYFPPQIRVFLNSSLPSLPLPDSYFDLIVACSVFTHLDEAETGWLLELRRILKVGGIACLSIHSQDTWSRMHGDLRDHVVKFRPDIADQSSLPEGKTVVTFRRTIPTDARHFIATHTFDEIGADSSKSARFGRWFSACKPSSSVGGWTKRAVDDGLLSNPVYADVPKPEPRYASCIGVIICAG